MLNQSSGGAPLAGRTEVRVRGLTTITPAMARQARRPRAPEGEPSLDWVDREDPSNPFTLALAGDAEIAFENTAHPRGSLPIRRVG